MKQARLLVYHRDAKTYVDLLRKSLPDLLLHGASTPEEALPFIEEAEILLVGKIPDTLLPKARNLLWLASTWAGNEELIESPYLPERVLFTKATCYGEMMAEYVFAYCLSFIRHVSKYREDQREKVWRPKRPERLRGKTMGILGLGSVGKVIAQRAKDFGMDVLGLKRGHDPVAEVDELFVPEKVRELIPRVDYLVSALPLTPETYHFLKEPELGLLKEGATLFNIGRGKTIDEKALIQALRTRKIRAVLDVFETEPLPPESELWGMENVVVTPHVSGASIPEEVCDEFVENYERWVKGEPLQGLVDRKKGY